MIKDFEYFAPKTVEEALTLLSQYKERSKVIAGGQSLLNLMKQGLVTPKYLIDIKGISALDYIDFDKKEGLRIGALTSHRAIEKSTVIRNGFRVVVEMEQELASIEMRNWGTIGGNLCDAHPVDDPAPVLIALNGKLKIVSPSKERIMAVEDFFKGYRQSALQADELLAEIQVPNPPLHTGTAYAKFNLREHDMAIVSAAVSVTLNLENDTCSDVRIALGAVAPVAMRARKAEKVLVEKKITDNLLREVAQTASEEAKPISDFRGSEEYRRKLVAVLVKRVAKDAFDRAKRA